MRKHLVVVFFFSINVYTYNIFVRALIGAGTWTDTIN